MVRSRAPGPSVSPYTSILVCEHHATRHEEREEEGRSERKSRPAWGNVDDGGMWSAGGILVLVAVQLTSQSFGLVPSHRPARGRLLRFHHRRVVRVASSSSRAAGTETEEDDDAAFRRRTVAIAESWPFVGDPDLVTEDVRLNSPACLQQGAESVLAASLLFQEELPQRLTDLRVLSNTVLPPDRRLIRGKCTIAFAAPLPLQILPAQRSRIQSAQLELRPDGLIDTWSDPN